MIIEETKALGAVVLFFPEGKNDEGDVACSETHMPDPDDAGWVDLKSIEAWEGSRQNPTDVKIYDSRIGRKVLKDELELGGDIEYKFTTNFLTAFATGLFFRSAAPLTPNSFQFNPDQKTSPRGWMIMNNRDQDGTQILAANWWGKMKFTGTLKGGAGEVIKPELTFMLFQNDLNTQALGTEA
jgi:hypothetical protein